MLMSLVQSGPRLEDAPHAYLHNLLDRVSTHPASRVDDLSPDRRVLPGRRMDNSLRAEGGGLRRPNHREDGSLMAIRCAAGLR